MLLYIHVGEQMRKIVGYSPSSRVRGGGQRAVIVLQKGSEYMEVAEW